MESFSTCVPSRGSVLIAEPEGMESSYSFLTVTFRPSLRRDSSAWSWATLRTAGTSTYTGLFSSWL